MWQQIVLNLLSNAFKFTFEGGISVEIETARSGGHVEVTVRDTGTGIRTARSCRASSTVFIASRGRAAGPSRAAASAWPWCRNWCGRTAAASKCRARSALGSAFTVSLPFGKGHLPQDRVFEARIRCTPEATRGRAFVDEALGWLSDTRRNCRECAPSPRARANRGRRAATSATGQRVLLADDNPDMRAYLRRLLEESGLSVEAVERRYRRARSGPSAAPGPRS